jgi:hypothetical protein
MKKKKISGLSLKKSTVSSLEASNLSGGTGTYDCYTFGPPCVSATEPPEDLTFICIPPPNNSNNCLTNYPGCPPHQTLGHGCGSIACVSTNC